MRSYRARATYLHKLNMKGQEKTAESWENDFVTTSRVRESN